METKTEIRYHDDPIFFENINIPSKATTNTTTTTTSTDNRNLGIKSINLAGDKLIITAQLSGVFCQGVQYYDLKNILFINNSGMAKLIDLLKSLLKEGVEVQFVNVNEKIKERIKSMGLDNIIHCH